ncbi:MAG: 6-carboxytetrahydropterin synthase [Phycisphaerales bacterium]|jgi:6-pyruvoyltetrahydropterin/6-carboxytetrahydropterin synthase|nr:6-carboxytetrahydropterin synthase [Phycisphaerales bacterium]
MFQLTREVRFAVNDGPDKPADGPTNGFGGYPTIRGLGRYFELRVTLEGALDPQSGYLRNIREIDSVVRQRAIPLVRGQLESGRATGEAMVTRWADELADAWPGAKLARLELGLSPQFSVVAVLSELPMIQVSQMFEFSAAHRLHNPALSGDENLRLYGKCNNPHGHGHNYEIKVTMRGEPDENGLLIDTVRFERLVKQNVIDKFDHKHLNIEVNEFLNLIPTVENIAKVVYQLLRPAFAGEGVQLSSVTVWETPKTWCEYSE